MNGYIAEKVFVIELAYIVYNRFGRRRIKRADAKFTDSDTTEVEYLVKSVAEYDRIIKTKYANADLSDANFELYLPNRLLRNWKNQR